MEEGDTFDDALQDITSAPRFHRETFGSEGLEPEDPVIDAFIVWELA